MSCSRAKGRKKRQKSHKEGEQVEEEAVEGPAEDSGSEQKRWEVNGTEGSFRVWGVVPLLQCLPEANIK